MDLPFSTASDHAVCMTLGRYIATIIAQQWLDKKRAQFNPYLLIGAPILGLYSNAFQAECATFGNNKP